MKEIKNVAVVGAGVMGHGIAQVFAQAGYPTVLIDTFPGAIDKAKKMVAFNLESQVANDFISKEQADTCVKNLTYAETYEGAKDADFVVEAVPEKVEIKRAVFAELSKVCREDTILSSTTSAMNVPGKVAKVVTHPERVIITHFNNPSNVIPLVEIVGGKKTDPELIANIRTLIAGIGKSPVVLKKWVPGFIVNRLNAALSREAAYIVAKGWASAEDVDTAFSSNQGLKAPFEGPLTLMDHIGWDTALNAGKFIYLFLSNSIVPPKLAKKLVKQGNLGVKTGKGLFDYQGRTREEIQGERNAKVIKLVKLQRELKEEKK